MFGGVSFIFVVFYIEYAYNYVADLYWEWALFFEFVFGKEELD
jgi:hypothetical protein